MGGIHTIITYPYNSKRKSTGINKTKLIYSHAAEAFNLYDCGTTVFDYPNYTTFYKKSIEGVYFYKPIPYLCLRPFS